MVTSRQRTRPLAPSAGVANPPPLATNFSHRLRTPLGLFRSAQLAQEAEGYRRIVRSASDPNPGHCRPCENNSTRRGGARLIREGCYLRNKDSSRHYVRFYYCAFTTFPGVFNKPVTPGF